MRSVRVTDEDWAHALAGGLLPGVGLILSGHWLAGALFAAGAGFTWYNLSWRLGGPVVAVHVCAGLYTLLQRLDDRRRAQVTAGRLAERAALIRRWDFPVRFRRLRR
ncbi:MAG: hypothetical protein KBA51_06250 [Kiritimatiellae bacterium]|nr:hypothetical protein [Kiritimatiellia bacterium]